MTEKVASPTVTLKTEGKHCRCGDEGAGRAVRKPSAQDAPEKCRLTFSPAATRGPGGDPFPPEPGTGCHSGEGLLPHSAGAGAAGKGPGTGQRRPPRSLSPAPVRAAATKGATGCAVVTHPTPEGPVPPAAWEQPPRSATRIFLQLRTRLRRRVPCRHPALRDEAGTQTHRGSSLARPG